MTRSVPEWKGTSPDTPVPQRVRLRVFERDQGRCQCGCRRRITPSDAWQTDHKIAVINGGENRERNLETLLMACHLAKTACDVAEKSKVYERKSRHLGLRKSKRPLPGGRSSPWKKKISGEVVRR